MASVASQSIEEVTAHAQSDSLEDAREICADSTYFPYNLRIIILFYTKFLFLIIFQLFQYFVIQISSISRCSTFINYHTKKCPRFNHPTQLDHVIYVCINVAKLVLCGIALIWFSDGGLLRVKICRNVQGNVHTHVHTHIYIYRVSQEECARLRECVPYVKVYRYNPKHLYPKLNGYGDNGQKSLKLWQLLHIYWLPNIY